MPPSPTFRALRAATTHLRPATALHRATRRPQHIQSRLRSTPRTFTTTPSLLRSRPPQTHDRGPPSSEETQTDFDKLDVLANMPAPTTAIDATFDDGFAMNSGLQISGAGVLLVAGDAFKWRPWIREHRREGTVAEGAVGNDVKGGVAGGTGTLRNERGMWECDRTAWGALEVVWPKPDLLIIGTGASVVPVSPTTRKHINDLGIRLEVSDTRNAAAQFNLLATERGVQQVAAALVPIGWKEGR
ncbi:hypothetical protein B0J12DRAFT_682396 [Macrophomina phaseolina]|uniref:NADH dehydrogenase [ubiquinone] 1 alpha subcomplex assembly factor 3 n=1 Tax=Macrophomina phaseolina TaxID=35725 RepID=A0ABQ8FW03_9PEZI|nr:hypothetical protein B0J12DRAFT_682396 [Macrophomina phaseolina]